MKWFKRIAQGFNPGFVAGESCPESGTRSWGVACGFKTEDQHTRLGRHFSSVVPYSQNYGGQAARHPGLKPWAVLSDHFMVIVQNGTAAICASENDQTQIGE
jgi:hypothetical protein